MLTLDLWSLQRVTILEVGIYDYKRNTKIQTRHACINVTEGREVERTEWDNEGSLYYVTHMVSFHGHSVCIETREA